MNKIDIKLLTKKIKIRYILSVIFILFILFSCIISDIFLIIKSSENYLINLILSIFISTLILSIIIFYFLNINKPLSYLYSLLKNYCPFNEKIEIVEIINREKIIKNKMEFDSIKVSFIDENKIYTKQLLLLDELNINNKKIKALTYQNYLIGFEGIDDENIIEKNN